MTERANAVTPNRQKPWLTLKMREMMEAWLFVSPTFIGFLIFFLGPLFAVMYYSLTEWNLLTQQAAFVGVANYENALLDNPDFWLVVRNSVIFAIGLVPLNMALALGLALALSRPFFGVVFFRTVFFAPVITSAIAWAIVWKFLLQGEGGFINQILATVGVTGPNWLREPNWAMAAVIVTRVIKMVGLNMILYLAALQAIPRDYEDAARLEGASRRQIFAMVTWPLLAPTTLVIMVITTIGSFKVFDHIYQMTGGGPENGTLVLAFYIYQQGFKFFNIGYASALAMIMFVIVMALTLVQVMLRRKGAQ
ncbi:carbohydrate ABC transporter permease [Pseudorhizobium marinum]|mgnify:FL=1|uniref:carbohydrate ABC transporter permease n=1 Tax=Pseudorhizobium marinum TaxID=1496690 RepID=UPI000496C36D|nr:sugar ABC transporter permease [Pseudorhizobium marinum]MBU1314491.1 sugar ABC transporter permease [Alphaproteobacteria bacterium]MBU1551576.1 sugar ABC transporter permease [Alphaproteobacteria bacterium]MBU2337311.1 sugar ABC transporter permease [Alphaproteobacteria bacterium]MBU2388054.1 sugar ABC transporter permease [Alphaproteobacteria bacterium]